MRHQISPDELDLLYRNIGKCVWHLQYVEDGLQTLLAMKVEIKTPGAVSETEAHELLANHRRATLGTALRSAERHNILPNDLFKRLSQLKDERDWLVHRSVQQDGDGLYTVEGRTSILRRLAQFVEEATKLQKELLAEVDSFVRSHGLSTENAEQMALQKIAWLKGEA